MPRIPKNLGSIRCIRCIPKGRLKKRLFDIVEDKRKTWRDSAPNNPKNHKRNPQKNLLHPQHPERHPSFRDRKSREKNLQDGEARVTPSFRNLVRESSKASGASTASLDESLMITRNRNQILRHLYSFGSRFFGEKQKHHRNPRKHPQHPQHPERNHQESRQKLVQHRGAATENKKENKVFVSSYNKKKTKENLTGILENIRRTRSIRRRFFFCCCFVFLSVHLFSFSFSFTLLFIFPFLLFGLRAERAKICIIRRQKRNGPRSRDPTMTRQGRQHPPPSLWANTPTAAP